MNYIKNNWHKAALLIILFVAGFLSFYDIGQEGYANKYYSAAVRSMLTSWHNFFYASFDAGGYVTVDKPAFGLWLQAISALVFGFHGWSLILPQALSTVVSVGLIYHLVQRFFGKIAGILSALILALTPILIAVSRTNNLDASLVMVVILAAWAMIVAAERGSFKLLLVSVVLVGIGFNIKMLEAFMVIPALYLLYLLTSPLKISKRILQLTGATAVLLAVSLSWAMVVELTPANSRPYVGSSTTNSVIELAIGYNGLQRITGFHGVPGVGGINGNKADSSNVRDIKAPSNIGGEGRERGNPPDRNIPWGSNPGSKSQDGSQGNGEPGDHGGTVGFGGPGGVGETGQKGVLRIFNKQLAGQIGWFIVMALFGVLVLGLRAYIGKSENRKSVLRQFILWTAWIVPMLVYFSISGFFHRYYLSMLAPAIAALSGIGIAEMWNVYMKNGWRWVLLPAALAANGIVQGCILWRYEEFRDTLLPVVGGVSFLSALALCIIRLMKKDNLKVIINSVTAVGFAALIIAPAIWAYMPILYGSDTHLPNAGPELAKNEGSGWGMQLSGISLENPETTELINFLVSKRQGEKFLAAVPNATDAEPIIIKTGEAVMAVGGYKGSDNILTIERLEQMVDNNELRFFLVSGMGMQSQINHWVREHGKVVSYDGSGNNGADAVDSGNNNRGGFTKPGRGINSAGTLYDLAPQKG